MAEKTAEQLSALIDGEVEDLELDLALRRLGRDSELIGRWERYHMISDALKNNLPESLDPDFAGRISRAIQEEQTPAAAPSRQSSPQGFGYRSIAGFGLAASLAVAVFIGLQTQPGDSSDPPVGPSLVTAPSETQPQTLAGADELEQRLDTYMINHNGFASRNSVNAVLPYIRMVSHGNNP
ncbi:MAG: sigma-E factor negative regulatory protein [Candidatus Competibacteraceae bacterium]|nr:sigma-E factor negative regulatory protein [Candidatus Competibacteraceae bacterium]